MPANRDSNAAVRQLAPEIDVLLRSIEAAFDKKSWHGTNLRGSIRSVDLQLAAWRPADGRHNIWEIVVHTAYWKYIVRRRLCGEKRGSFPLKGSNWFVRPLEVSKRAWQDDVALLEEMHRTMYTAIAEMSPADLLIIPSGSKLSNFAHIAGIAAHDVYHAGQIQLLKRLAGETAPPARP